MFGIFFKCNGRLGDRSKRRVCVPTTSYNNNSAGRIIVNRYSLSNADLPKRTDGESVECNNNNNILYHIVTCTIYIYITKCRDSQTRSRTFCAVRMYIWGTILSISERRYC